MDTLTLTSAPAVSFSLPHFPIESNKGAKEGVYARSNKQRFAVHALIPPPDDCSVMTAVQWVVLCAQNSVHVVQGPFSFPRNWSACTGA